MSLLTQLVPVPRFMHDQLRRSSLNALQHERDQLSKSLDDRARLVDENRSLHIRLEEKERQLRDVLQVSTDADTATATEALLAARNAIICDLDGQLAIRLIDAALAAVTAVQPTDTVALPEGEGFCWDDEPGEAS